MYYLQKSFVLNHSNKFINKNKLSFINKLDWFDKIHISDFIVKSLKINEKVTFFSRILRCPTQCVYMMHT